MKTPIIAFKVNYLDLKVFAQRNPKIPRKKLIREFVIKRCPHLIDPAKGYLVRYINLLRNLQYECRLFERVKKNKPNRAALLLKALRTPAGMNKLAQAMANPIRRSLDYKSISKKFIDVTPVSTKTLIGSFDLDYNEEIKSIKNEVENLKPLPHLPAKEIE